MHCSRQLGWQENVPLVSYLWLRGKCATCQGKIPADYFWVELMTPLVLVLTTYYHLYLTAFNRDLYFRDVFFSLILIVVFVYDFKYQEIISGLIWLGAVAAGVLNYLVFGYSWQSLGLAALVGGGFFLAQYVVSRGRWIGGGDVRLGVLMGLLLGWPLIVLALGASYILGMIVAVPLLLLRKKNMNSAIPFGTFLAAATWAAMLGGGFLVNWYLNLVKW